MKKLIPSYIRVPVVFFAIAGLVEYFMDNGDEFAFMNPIVLLFLLLVFLILVAIEGIVSSMDNILFQSLDEEAKARYITKQNEFPLLDNIKVIYKKLLGAKPIEEEGEIILDHNYDGIKELDNSLPPWWLYGFYATIIFAVIYMVRFHIIGVNDQFAEYDIEYAEAQRAIEAYKKTAKDLVDFNTVELLTEATDINAGKKIFNEKCVACHKIDGGGGIGPNLTDNYWILGGGIKNVFKTISEGGRDGKGMVSWKKEGLKPSEIAQVASYVLQFQGTTPAEPKAAEGEIWLDENVKPKDEAKKDTVQKNSKKDATAVENSVASNN